MSITFDFTGKVIALTGAASGIGLETAKLLAASGAKLSIADVREGPLNETASALSKSGKGEIFTTVLNVTDASAVKSWIDSTVKKFGKLDGAANLAGVIPAGMGSERVEEVTDKDWDFVIGINLTGVMSCMRAEIGNMNEGGSIVNAASIAGIEGFAKNSSYVASKHGVVGLTRAAAKEVGDRNIRVNCIAPGLIETPMLRAAEEKVGTRWAGFPSAIKRKGLPEEVAELIAWLLCDGSKFMSGTVQSIDGAWHC